MPYGARVPHLFYSYRDYRHPNIGDILGQNAGGPEDYQIWQIGRATCAAPSYFKPTTIEIKRKKMSYIDGGYPNNNPSEEVYRSVKHLHNQDPLTVKVFVSIGTGTHKMNRISSRVPPTSEETHQRLLDATRNLAEYFRLNVEHGLDKIEFDEWKGKKGDKTLQLIRTRTEEYLKSPDGEELIAVSARRLVEIRRDRSFWPRDLDLWERFCYGVEYVCPVRDCGDVGVYKTRQHLQSHLDTYHRIEPDRLEAVVDEGKRFPLEKPH